MYNAYSNQDFYIKKSRDDFKERRQRTDCFRQRAHSLVGLDDLFAGKELPGRELRLGTLRKLFEGLDGPFASARVKRDDCIVCITVSKLPGQITRVMIDMFSGGLV